MEFIVKADLMEELEKKSYSYGSKRFIREFPTVKAISIEWIKKWLGKLKNVYDDSVYQMLEDWEKENDNN